MDTSILFLIKNRLKLSYSTLNEVGRKNREITENFVSTNEEFVNLLKMRLNKETLSRDLRFTLDNYFTALSKRLYSENPANADDVTSFTGEYPLSTRTKSALLNNGIYSDAELIEFVDEFGVDKLMHLRGLSIQGVESISERVLKPLGKCE